MHPLGFTHGQRLSEHYLNNILGNPLESAIALAHLIFGGVFEAHPRLKALRRARWRFPARLLGPDGSCVPCSRGLPTTHSAEAVELSASGVARHPRLRPRRVDSLVRTHGADRLCLGTDYPFDMAEPDPLGFHARLEESNRAKILGLNAAALLGLQVMPRA